MEILECDICKQIITMSTKCICGHKKDYLYAVEYIVSSATEEEE
jgi:hypothetical protein